MTARRIKVTLPIQQVISLKPGGSGTPLKPAALIIDTESSVDLEDIIARFAFGSVDKK